MSNIKKLTCDNCGGHIDPATLTCLSCGTAYEREESYPDVLRIVTESQRTELLQCSVLVPNEFLYHDPDKTIEYAIREMSRKFSEKLLPFIELEMRERFKTCETELSGRLRVAEPRRKNKLEIERNPDT